MGKVIPSERKKVQQDFGGKYSVLIQLNVNPMKQSKIDES